ncbi:hypothetical protein C8R45DRAFT_124588 [Mycena sanguinolenta]|nr:hypothetical protein C8R45DRAFT_124588 [Mycena sanguinolenta]
MFSKVIALLGALALAQAAPAVTFKTPMLSLSCSANFDTSVAPVKSFAGLEPGNYKIFNEEFGNGALRAYSVNEAISVSKDRQSLGPYAMWTVSPSGEWGSHEFTIANLGLGDSTYVSNEEHRAWVWQRRQFLHRARRTWPIYDQSTQ